MKNTYFKAGGNAVAVNFKAGSATLARAIIRDFQPETEAMIHNTSGDGNGVAYPEGRGPDSTLWQGQADKVKPEEVTLAHLLVRDPTEKFRSACQMSKVTDVDAKLDAIESEGFARDAHFWPQSRFTNTDLKLYKFPDHFDALATDIGLTLPLPVVNESGSLVPGEKPTLTAEQQARVEAIYADDIEIYESITEAGQLYTAPPAEPGPEPFVPVPQRLTSWQAKAALSLTPHAQAGTLLAAVEAALNAMPEGPEKIVVGAAWNCNANFERQSPTITAIGAALGLDAEAIDAVFRLGDSLEV